ncbi:MAG: translation initiation factor 2 subunit beta [Terrestrivirus sp.]|uniref:Translation initiation factor 2 subunit beta n=1 Tax=Terrestrivirus sp. TaxID=2487775 RepID=A0A3G4ZMB9_9VIRU|nr:MAG: translation initiation factor 2 subunit beta [Terrestrivirus sp.]
MSKSINVRGLTENIDPTYRYRMPPIQITKQKTKSVITNIKEVCKALDRDPLILVDYFKKKFSTPMNVDLDENRVELKSIEQNELQNAIFEFIEYFILCPTCRNPETDLSNKKTTLYIKCRACSHYGPLQMHNKLVNKVSEYIVKSSS